MVIVQMAMTYMACVSVVACALGLFRLLEKWLKRILQECRHRLPPGPTGWPIVGNLLVMGGPQVHTYLQEMGQRYRGMFTMQFGPRKVIMLTSYQRFREVFVDRPWDFSGRPPELQFDGVPVKGIVAAGIDDDARSIRKFTLVTLRSLGFGKMSMQDTILTEALNLIEEFRQYNGRSFNPRTPIANASANVIAGVLLGKTFPHGSNGFRTLMDSLLQGIEVMNISEKGKMLPFLKPFLRKSYRERLNQFLYGIKYLRTTVDEHVATKKTGCPRDFIDCWLEHAEKGGKAFDAKHLTSVIFDMFTGGFETSCSTVLWVLSMMLHYPDVQKRVQAEIDAVMGKEEPITLDHREKLVYTEAVILETMRKYPLVPFGVPHASTMETNIGGYRIPEGMRVMVHVYSIHHDSALWQDPDVFRPERFIVDGALKTPEYFIPFGAGRRSCIGEQLARKELFMFFATIMRTFHVTLPETVDLPSLQGTPGFVFYPGSFEIVLKERL